MEYHSHFRSERNDQLERRGKESMLSVHQSLLICNIHTCMYAHRCTYKYIHTCIHIHTYVYTHVCINVIIMCYFFRDVQKWNSKHSFKHRRLKYIWSNMFKTKFLISPCSPSQMYYICSYPISVKIKSFLSQLLRPRPWCCPWLLPFSHKPCPTHPNILFVVEFNDLPSPRLALACTLWAPLNLTVAIASKSMQAAVAEHHPWDGLISSYSSQFWKLEAWDQGASMVRQEPSCGSQTSHCVLTW